jgi:NitT/TauT family transport system substrate-binding protein
MRSSRLSLAVVVGHMLSGLLLVCRVSYAADDAHTLSLRLDWLPLGSHTPFYLAVEKGWYRKAGLDVSITQGTGSATTVQLVGTGQFDVGYAALSNMAFARSKGMPVISIAGFFRKGDIALLVPVDSPIKAPSDLKGKRIITSAGSMEVPFIDSFLAKGGLTREQVELLSIDPASKMSMYASGGADGVFGTPIALLAEVERRRPTRPLLLAEFGLNIPSFGLFTNQQTLKKKGEALRAFASISAGSWAYVASKHEDEAVQALLKARLQDRIDPNQIQNQLKNSILFLYSPATANLPIGVQSAEDWAHAIDLMEKVKVIAPGSEPTDYFTNGYLDLNLMKLIAAGG